MQHNPNAFADYLATIDTEHGTETEGYAELNPFQRIVFQLCVHALRHHHPQCIAWDDKYMTMAVFTRTLSLITTDPKEQPGYILERLLDRYDRFHMLQLRPLSKHRSIRKLIVGCGHHPVRYRLDYEYNAFARQLFPSVHPKLEHPDADTVCDELMYDPTVVGTFETDPTKAQSQFWPSNFYDLIYPENIYLPLKEQNWRTIERVLRPGGFFLYLLYMEQEEAFRMSRFPEDSKLVWHSLVTLCTAFCLPHDTLRGHDGEWCWSDADVINPGKSDAYALTEWWQTEFGVYRGFVLIAKRNLDGSVPEFREELVPAGKYIKIVKRLIHE